MTWVGYRTFIVAALSALVSGVGIVDDPSNHGYWLALIVSAGMAGMRTITTTPSGRK